jgi:farnesyl diphosphate synthase
MIMCGLTDPAQFKLARKILLIMGEYFQIQDDYLVRPPLLQILAHSLMHVHTQDCYGAPEVIGKIGTDIQDRKCSWLVVQALKKATPAQRQILEINYGQDVPQKVAKVKKLYEEMGLEDLFKKYEEESYAAIKKLIGEVNDMPTEVFEFLLKKIYKRSK